MRAAFRGWTVAARSLSPSRYPARPDGSREILIRGRRFEQRPDGSLVAARQVLPDEDVTWLALPRRLGGGYLFSVVEDGVTALWRSTGFTGTLEPLTRVEGAVEEVVPGIDRLYLRLAPAGELSAIDAASGAPLGLAPLPVAATYGPIVFADAWRGVAVPSLRGALATFDAGESWEPLGLASEIESLSVDAEEAIVLETGDGALRLEPGGQLTRRTAGVGAVFRQGVVPSAALRSAEDDGSSGEQECCRVGPLGARPLRDALLAGVPDTPDTAVVVVGRSVGRISLADGRVLSSQPYDGALPCRGVVVGKGVGFVCGGSRGAAEVYEYEAGRMRLLHRWDRPTAIRPSGSGALVAEGPCPREPASQASGGARYCVVRGSGRLSSLRTEGRAERQRVVALADGRTVVVRVPSGGEGGTLRVFGPGGSSSTVPLELHGGDAELTLAGSGLWIDDMREIEPDKLGTWVVGARGFAGVVLGMDGSVQVGPLQEAVDEALLSGAAALHFAGASSLRESLDQGRSWSVSELPPAVLSPLGEKAERERGCSLVGCVYDDWGRVGFRGNAPPMESQPELPEALPPGGYSFSVWNLQCAPAGGEIRPPPSTPMRLPERSARERWGGQQEALAPESSGWSGLLGLPAPRLPEGYRGYDLSEVGARGAFRAYAWGPPGGPWTASGGWLARVADRFSRSPPWSTGIAPSPWDNAAEAATAFGLEPTVGVDWRLSLASSGQAALLHVRVRAKKWLHLLEPGRAPITTRLSGAAEIGRIEEVAKVGEEWLLGALSAEEYHLYKVREGELRLFATYPRVDRLPLELVTTPERDRVALLQKTETRGWMLFPLDLTTGELGAAIVIPRRSLQRVPPRCQGDDAFGYEIQSGVPLSALSPGESNVVVEFSGGAEPFRSKRLVARLVAGFEPPCLSEVAALVEGVPSWDFRLSPGPLRENSVPLTATESVSERRWLFRCTP